MAISRKKVLSSIDIPRIIGLVRKHLIKVTENFGETPKEYKEVFRKTETECFLLNVIITEKR